MNAVTRRGFISAVSAAVTCGISPAAKPPKPFRITLDPRHAMTQCWDVNEITPCVWKTVSRWYSYKTGTQRLDSCKVRHVFCETKPQPWIALWVGEDAQDFEERKRKIWGIPIENVGGQWMTEREKQWYENRKRTGSDLTPCQHKMTDKTLKPAQ